MTFSDNIFVGGVLEKSVWLINHGPLHSYSSNVNVALKKHTFHVVGKKIIILFLLIINQTAILKTHWKFLKGTGSEMQIVFRV